MGLDLSLRGTGLMVLQEGVPCEWRHLPTQAGDRESAISGVFKGSDEGCIEWIVSQIGFSWKFWLPDLVVIEDYAYKARGRGKSVLAEVAGVCKNRLHRAQAPYLSINGMTAKASVFGKGHGHASKSETIQLVRGFWADCPENDDVADAYVLAKFGHLRYDDLVSE